MNLPGLMRNLAKVDETENIIPKVLRFIFLALAKGENLRKSRRLLRCFVIALRLAHRLLRRNESARPRATCATPLNSVRRIPIPNEMIRTPVTIKTIATTGNGRGGTDTAASGVGINTAVAVAIGIGVIVGSGVGAVVASAVGDGIGVGVAGKI